MVKNTSERRSDRKDAVERVWYDMNGRKVRCILALFVQNAHNGKFLLFHKLTVIGKDRMWKTLWKLCKTLMLSGVFGLGFFLPLLKTLVKRKIVDFSFSVE